MLLERAPRVYPAATGVNARALRNHARSLSSIGCAIADVLGQPLQEAQQATDAIVARNMAN